MSGRDVDLPIRRLSAVRAPGLDTRSSWALFAGSAGRLLKAILGIGRLNCLWARP